MTTNTFRLVVTVLLFATLSTLANATPKEAGDAPVKHCQLIGNVNGSSGYGKHSRWKPIAQTNAMQKASILGATHMVYGNYRAIGTTNGVASARAYICH